MTKARPIGVSIVSILLILAAGEWLYLWVQLSFSAYEIWDRNAKSAAQAGIGPLRFFFGGQPLQGLLNIVGMISGVVVPLIVAAALILFGVYLWRLREWARVAASVLLGLGAVTQIEQLFFMRYDYGHARLVSFLMMSIEAGIVWYLWQTEVREAFAASRSTGKK